METWGEIQKYKNNKTRYGIYEKDQGKNRKDKKYDGDGYLGSS